MNRNQVDNWRTDTQARLEELTVMSAKQSGEITHIKQTVDEIKDLKIFIQKFDARESNFMAKKIREI